MISAWLVTPQALAEHPEWRVFDCRHDLQNTAYGRNAWAREHIPGAVHLHLDDDLSGAKDGTNGRHPLPAIEAFSARVSACGVDAGTQVVAYDNEGSIFAARLWWLLRWLGHDRVAVLDGGLAGWKRAGLPLTAEAATIAPRRFEPHPRHDMIVDTAAVLRHLTHGGDRLIVDARSPERFAGRNETLDPVGGHIPGAINRFYFDNLDDSGSHFRPADELRAEFSGLLGTRTPDAVIQQCGSGVTACHNLLAMEIAGLSGSRLYPGSWSAWCADPARPMARD